MAGSQIATSVTILSSGLKGYQAISLTEFDTSAVSSIAAGSTVEIGGAFFIFSTEEAASGFSAITTATTAYLHLSPSGSAGSQIVSAAWSETAPVWVTSKGGWYASAGSVTRVVALAGQLSSTSSPVKAILSPTQSSTAQIMIEIGPWNMDTTATLYVYPGITMTDIVRVTGVVFNDALSAVYPIPYFETSGYFVVMFGPLEVSAGRITLYRRGTGAMDSSSFDDSTMNRGYLIIEYRV